MYYHILYKIPEISNPIIEKNIEEYEEILDDYFIPYLQSKPFFIDGREIIKKRNDIFKVFKSDVIFEILKNECAQHLRRKYPNIITVPTKDEALCFFATEITKQSRKEAQKRIDNNTINSNQSQIFNAPIDRTKVFIVHGHDENVINEVDLLLSKQNLSGIVLKDQPNQGKTIIEKIETNSNVGYGIILYTPCDEGYVSDKPDEKKYRARQNVIFEHGYLTAKLGREKICALVKGNIELPGDISGTVHITFEKGWQFKVLQELAAAGYEIDFKKCSI